MLGTFDLTKVKHSKMHGSGRWKGKKLGEPLKRQLDENGYLPIDKAAQQIGDYIVFEAKSCRQALSSNSPNKHWNKITQKHRILTPPFMNDPQYTDAIFAQCENGEFREFTFRKQPDFLITSNSYNSQNQKHSKSYIETQVTLDNTTAPPSENVSITKHPFHYNEQKKIIYKGHWPLLPRATAGFRNKNLTFQRAAELAPELLAKLLEERYKAPRAQRGELQSRHHFETLLQQQPQAFQTLLKRTQEFSLSRGSFEEITPIARKLAVAKNAFEQLFPTRPHIEKLFEHFKRNINLRSSSPIQKNETLISQSPNKIQASLTVVRPSSPSFNPKEHTIMGGQLVRNNDSSLPHTSEDLSLPADFKSAVSDITLKMSRSRTQRPHMKEIVTITGKEPTLKFVNVKPLDSNEMYTGRTQVPHVDNTPSSKGNSLLTKTRIARQKRRTKKLDLLEQRLSDPAELQKTRKQHAHSTIQRVRTKLQKRKEREHYKYGTRRPFLNLFSQRENSLSSQQNKDIDSGVD